MLDKEYVRDGKRRIVRSVWRADTHLRRCEYTATSHEGADH